jgi:hypothetical protein
MTTTNGIRRGRARAYSRGYAAGRRKAIEKSYYTIWPGDMVHYDVKRLHIVIDNRGKKVRHVGVDIK